VIVQGGYWASSGSWGGDKRAREPRGIGSLPSTSDHNGWMKERRQAFYMVRR